MKIRVRKRRKKSGADNKHILTHTSQTSLASVIDTCTCSDYLHEDHFNKTKRKLFAATRSTCQ